MLSLLDILVWPFTRSYSISGVTCFKRTCGFQRSVSQQGKVTQGCNKQQQKVLSLLDILVWPFTRSYSISGVTCGNTYLSRNFPIEHNTFCMRSCRPKYDPRSNNRTSAHMWRHMEKRLFPVALLFWHKFGPADWNFHNENSSDRTREHMGASSAIVPRLHDGVYYENGPLSKIRIYSLAKMCHGHHQLEHKCSGFCGKPITITYLYIHQS